MVVAILVGVQKDGLHIVVFLDNGEKEETTISWDTLNSMMGAFIYGD